MKVIAEVDYKSSRECPVWAILYDNMVHKEWTFIVDDGEGFFPFLSRDVKITDARLDGFVFFPNPGNQAFLMFEPLTENNLYFRIQEFEAGAYQEFRETLERMSHPYS